MGFFDRMRSRGKDPNGELKRVLGEYQLPAFSGVVLEALKVMRNPDASSADIGRVLSADPRLSIDMLRMANSAHGGAACKIDNVSQAVSMLGRSAVEALVLSIGVCDALPRPTAPGFDRARFWTAAARRAAVARAFAGYLHPAQAMESFTASLLQDMAIPVLAQRRGDTYSPILEAWHRGEGELAAMEQSEFGWDHSEVGGWLCDAWGLPDRLASAIGSHHLPQPEMGDDCPPAVALVGLLRETEDEPGIDELVAVARDSYGIPEQDSADLLEASLERVDSIVRMFL